MWISQLSAIAAYYPTARRHLVYSIVYFIPYFVTAKSGLWTSMSLYSWYQCLYSYWNNCPEWGCWVHGGISNSSSIARLFLLEGSAVHHLQGVKVFLLLRSLRREMLLVCLIFADRTNKSSNSTFPDQSFSTPLKSLFSLLWIACLCFSSRCYCLLSFYYQFIWALGIFYPRSAESTVCHLTFLMVFFS